MCSAILKVANILVLYKSFITLAFNNTSSSFFLLGNAVNSLVIALSAWLYFLSLLNLLIYFSTRTMVGVSSSCIEDFYNGLVSKIINCLCEIEVFRGYILLFREMAWILNLDRKSVV